MYRSDDRGDNWTRVSTDLSRNLKWQELPIMGKVWPLDSVAYHESTTALSNIVTIDESPLREGLIWVGTDDGLVQVTEDGGKNWRKIEQFPNVPQYTYVTDVFPSPRDADTVFVSLNNWQRGDYKPVHRQEHRSRPHLDQHHRNLPEKHDVWSVIQDHVNGNLLFAGTEFGVFTSVDGGQRWVQLKGGLPDIQVRDMAVQKRENDLVLGTFGRGFYVLDDYSALREIAVAEALSQDEAPAVSAARRLHLQPARHGARGHRRDRRDVGQLDGGEPAVRRGFHLQRQRDLRGRQAGVEHHRREQPPDPEDRTRQGVGFAADRVEPAR